MAKSANLYARIEPEVKEQAEAMCSKWKEKNQEIYAFVMKTLMSMS